MQGSPKRQATRGATLGLSQALVVLADHAAASDGVPVYARRGVYKILVSGGSKTDFANHIILKERALKEKLKASELITRCLRRLMGDRKALSEALLHEVRAALAAGDIDVESPKEGVRLLVEAAAASDSDLLAEIIRHFQGSPPPRRALDEALGHAVARRHMHNANALLSAGADPGGIGYFNENTPLHILARSRRFWDQVRWCDLHTHWMARPEVYTAAWTHDGDTPLHQAHTSQAVAYLVNTLGTNTEVQNKRGETPLLTVAKRSTSSAIIALLRAGGDVNVRDNRGATPLHMVTMRYWERLGPFMNVANALLKHLGPDATARILSPEGGVGWTPLHEVRSPDIAAFFLRAGADLDAIDPKTGWSPLESVVARAAIARGDRVIATETAIKIAQVFLDAGAKFTVDSIMHLAKPSPVLSRKVPSMLEKKLPVPM